MASPYGQSERTRRRGSTATRQRLLETAAQLIAEVGWGRVTTRAVAARAQLPHGAVSYHFAGKQELLTVAALAVVERMFPFAELARLETLGDLLALVGDRLGDRDALDPVLSGVIIEAMRESARDPALRERMAELGRDYRRLVTDLVRADQGRAAVRPGAEPAGVAMLVIAACDGLLLHALFDPELEVGEAVRALRALACRSGEGC